jgi:hypothetical protein
VNEQEPHGLEGLHRRRAQLILVRQQRLWIELRLGLGLLGLEETDIDGNTFKAAGQVAATAAGQRADTSTRLTELRHLMIEPFIYRVGPGFPIYLASAGHSL